LQDGAQHGAETTEPELEAKTLMQGPEERIVLAVFDATLKGFLDAYCKRLDRTVGVDGPDVALF